MRDSIIDDEISNVISHVPLASPDDWAWYCSDHGVGGSARSAREVAAMVNTHLQFVLDNGRKDDLFCSVATALVPDREVNVTQTYLDVEGCACGLETHDDYRVHRTESGLTALV